MEEFLANIAPKYQLPFEKRNEGWEIKLPLRGEFTCKLDIGDKALDWYATVHHQQDDKQVWMDYYGYDSKLEEELIDDKKRDIIYFIEAWLSALDVRIVQKKGFLGSSTELELNLSGTWGRAPIYDPNR